MHDAPPDVFRSILALERSALDRWGRGDPDGYLTISTPEVTYFDPFVETRLDGRPALAAWYAPLRGTIRIDRDAIVAPRVVLAGDAAVLTFQYVSEGSEGPVRWNCTEVYERREDGWAIAHTHWSRTQASKSGP